MYNIRIQLFCLFLGMSSVAFSNVTDTTEIQTQQNELNNFYIKDDGSVSYTEEQTFIDSVFQEVEAVIPEVIDTVAVEAEEQVFFFSKERKDDVSKDLTVATEGVAEGGAVKNHTDEPLVAAVHSVVPIPIEIKHTASSKVDSLVESSTVNPEYVVKETKIAERSALDDIQKDELTEEEDDGYVPSYKRQSTYKNLEEATLASDRLLAQLKKKQQPTSKSGSLSSRVIRGGDYVRSTATRSDSNGRASADESEFDYETDFGNDPTYYINGVRVEKSDILRLRKKNILSRTMKLKDTASRNPNGEIWFEVKE